MASSTTPAPRGRPRSFDRDAALQHALTEFWRHGYEATSIATLTRAMGINPPSLYAAFGDKRKLFSEAVQHYVRTVGGYGSRALQQPTARAAVEQLLRTAAAGYTDPSHPPGCLVVRAATNCTDASADVEAELRAIREGTKHALEEKIRADLTAGLLPATADPRALAAFYAAVVQGMSVQACDGADHADLDAIATTALAAWPS
ncbi:TetR/AcrR family transcriptional regulator [Kitasatospora sp. LaBMicrA B282]|uniref:TetR/AcrR family transcriptional regulator n=1 Tax=Kitasatospora sp. LaBMicrA B282 TaxID=3420949 RepID=UPI003D13650A